MSKYEHLKSSKKLQKEDKLGTRLLETVIASCLPRPDTRELLSPETNSWEINFPDLNSLDIGDIGNTSSKICIATEDIVGPVRNGGIGTTYSYLAKLLAAEGFDVTILYLRKDYVEIGTLEEWIKHYAEFGVKFIGVDDYYLSDRCAGNNDRWTAPMYNMLRHLQEFHYDVVHVSEWRGSGYLSLLAKRQGLALKNTHFIVKCSSPWLWNRTYGSLPLNTIDDIDKMFCERMSVELGDHIIGGSTHLLRWMLSQGYDLLNEKIFVQPNILSTEVLDGVISKRSLKPGDRVSIDEIVFFGRLEARKGLDIFINSINNLINSEVKLPSKISFMGKPGARIETRPDLNVLEFIKESSDHWPTEVQILTEFQQEAALSYLLDGNRLAVMPSHIENSSLAVYEASICGIPFIASNSGGTPELVEEKYHKDVLCDAHPLTLQKQLKAALTNGAIVAAPTFDNKENTKTWISYHRNIKKIIQNENHSSEEPKQAKVDICVIIPHRDDIEGLKNTLNNLAKESDVKLDVIVVDDGSRNTKTLTELDHIKLKIRKKGWSFYETPGIEYGLAANTAVKNTEAQFLYFTQPGNAVLPGSLSKMVKVLQKRDLKVLTSFSLEYSSNSIPSSTDLAEKIKMPILGNIGYTLLKNDLEHWDLLVDRQAFLEVGGFTGDYRQLNAEKELYHALEFNGHKGETIPLPLYWNRKIDNNAINLDGYNLRASTFRALRPSLRYGPLIYRNLFLLFYGLFHKTSKLERDNKRLRKDRSKQKELKLKRIKEIDKLKKIKKERVSELNSAREKLKLRDAIISENKDLILKQKSRSLFASINDKLTFLRGENSKKEENLKNRIDKLNKVREQRNEKEAKLNKVREQRNEKEAKLKAQNEKLNHVRAQRNEKEAKLKAQNEKLNHVRAERNEKETKLKARNSELDKFKKNLNLTASKLKERNSEVRELKKKLAQRKSGGEDKSLRNKNKLRGLFSSIKSKLTNLRPKKNEKETKFESPNKSENDNLHN